MSGTLFRYINILIYINKLVGQEISFLTHSCPLLGVYFSDCQMWNVIIQHQKTRGIFWIVWEFWVFDNLQFYERGFER
jgi:hypothetical protein